MNKPFRMLMIFAFWYMTFSPLGDYQACITDSSLPQEPGMAALLPCETQACRDCRQVCVKKATKCAKEGGTETECTIIFAECIAGCPQ
jgi:hypothetical protein